jgi:hypothetical protein
VIVSVPEKGPVVDGVQVTEIVHVPSAASVEVQVIELILKVGDPELMLGAGLRLIEAF